jgi:imidazolonepropionase
LSTVDEKTVPLRRPELPPRRVRLRNIGWLVPCRGPERGPLQNWLQLGGRADCDMIVEWRQSGWRLAWVGPCDALALADVGDIDLGGRLLVPGLADCHTHAVFAGDRSGEFVERMAGRSYADIAADGGGIQATVRATRQASLSELVAETSRRLDEMLAWGVRVVEIKTGYGLDVATELRLLQAIDTLRQQYAGRLHIVATAMPAHAVPPEFASHPSAWVTRICELVLPTLAQSKIPLAFVDIFLERGYFDTTHGERIWQAAKALGLGLKAHVDEFADIGGLEWAVRSGATSVEHLLQTTPEGITQLAESNTVAVCLPLTSVFLREPFAPMRALVDAGALLAVATDCNPGSAMTTNLPLAMQMAVLGGGLTPQEALRAVTRGAALALAEPYGYTGRLQVGDPFIASLFDLETPDDLFYHFGSPPNASSLLDALR